MAKMNLDNLEIEARRLVKLLEDRRPGLVSWRMMFDRTLKAIIDESGCHDYQPEQSADKCTCTERPRGVCGISTYGCKIHGG